MGRSQSPGSAGLTRRALLGGASKTAVVGAVVGAIPAGACAIAPQPAAQVAPVVRVGARAAAPGATLEQMTVNGTIYEFALDARWTLADFLREQLGMTGTKVACDRGECGACTVLLDGKPVLGCMTLAADAVGHTVQTVEGLAVDGQLNPLQQAFWDQGGQQCGFCTSGMLMSATALLAANPKPTEDEVRQAISGNLCRCTGYRKIVASILAASGQAPAVA